MKTEQLICFCLIFFISIHVPCICTLTKFVLQIKQCYIFVIHHVNNCNKKGIMMILPDFCRISVKRSRARRVLIKADDIVLQKLLQELNLQPELDIHIKTNSKSYISSNFDTIKETLSFNESRDTILYAFLQSYVKKHQTSFSLKYLTYPHF